MGHNLKREKQGELILNAWLTANERDWRLSDNKTYDYIVDGAYAEMKTYTPETQGATMFLTQNQYTGLKSGEMQRIFFVNITSGEIIEFTREELLAVEPHVLRRYLISAKKVLKNREERDYVGNAQ